MDLTNLFAHPKVNKEKRERQPNWTEAEKQLLLSLTRKHQNILENKGSDTMTIKRKSEVWDSIALNMIAAGYNRSKERLKQQLGRIKAAEAKKQRNILEKILITANSNNSNSTTAAAPCNTMQSVNFCIPMIGRNEFESNAEGTVPISLQDTNAIEINAKNTLMRQHNDGDALLMDDKPLGPSINTTINKPLEVDITAGQLTLNNVIPPPPLNSTDTMEMVSSGSTSGTSAAQLDATITTTEPTVSTRCVTTVRRNMPNTRKRRFRRLHMYRLAVERERLRTLKMQQKRDRILYRKDIQIQNLKLQILRNLTNQSLGTNRINF